MALTERSSTGFLTGGVSDTVPDWLGSYDEGYTAAQKQKETALSQQEAKQRMAESAAAEQRRALEFANTQADRAAAMEAAKLAAQMPSEVPFDATPGAGISLAPDTGTTAAPSNAKLNELLPEFAAVEEENGLPPGYLKNISILESSGGLNMGDGQFVGMFQIGPKVAKDFGITPEQAKDHRIAARVAAALAVRNAKMLRTRLNRTPQAWELYLAHQQGAGGAAALLQNPQMNAVMALAQAYGGDRERARAAIVQNGGNPNMTAGEFAALWAKKYQGTVSPATAQPAGLTGFTPAQSQQSAPSVTGPSDFPSYEVNRQGSPIGEYYRKAEADAARQSALQIIEGQLTWGASSSPIMDLGRQFFGTVEGNEQLAASKAQNATALEWYRAPNVREWLLANPQALTAASKDPLAFYSQYKDQLTVAPSAQPKSAAPAAPAPAAPQQTTPGLQTQPAAPVTPQQQPAAPAATTPGLQTQPAANVAPAGPASDALYAPGVDDGTGSLVDQIARLTTGETPKTPDLGLYIAEPARITNDRRRLALQQSEIQRQLQIASMTRDFATIYKLREQAVQNRLADNLLGAMDVIAQAQQGDDNAMAQAMSGLTQGRQRFLKRNDGTYNIEYDGKVQYEAVSRDRIIASLRMAYDEQFQAQAKAQADAAAKREEEYYKGQIDIAKEIAKQQAQLIREIKVEMQKAALKPADYNFSTVGEVIFAIPKEPGTGEVKAYRMVPVVDMNGEPVVDGAGKVKMVPQETGLQNAVPVQ